MSKAGSIGFGGLDGFRNVHFGMTKKEVMIIENAKPVNMRSNMVYGHITVSHSLQKLVKIPNFTPHP